MQANLKQNKMRTIEEKLANINYWLTKQPNSKKLLKRRAKYLALLYFNCDNLP